MESLLGTSLEDPRTMAVMSAVQGLLGGRGGLQGISNGLLAYGGAMQAAKQQQAAEELRKLQLQQHALQLKQMQDAAAQQAMDKQLTQTALSPIRGIEANQASGITGPRPEALKVVGQTPAFDPRQFVSQGGSLQGAASVAQLLAKERAKIKEFREVRAPDGSVQIVGLDEYGQPVKTGQTPFKDGDVQDFGGAKYVRDPITNKLTLLGNKTATPDARLGAGVTMRGQDMTDSRARELNAITREGNQTQVVTDPTLGVQLVNKGTGLMRPAVGPDGKPIPSSTQAKTAQGSAKVLSSLDEAEKLIDQSTGSFVGTGVDAAARAFGVGTSGAQANAKLKVIEGQIMMNQPRMEGPQSDKDTMLYRQMAGAIGDPTVPASVKKAALATVREIHQRYSGGQSDPLGVRGGDANDPFGLRAILQPK